MTPAVLHPAAARPRGPAAWRASSPLCPPNVVVAIKALACELPSRRGLPLARWSVAELRQEAVASGIVAQISGTTLWRWLGQDALRPWRHRSWLDQIEVDFSVIQRKLLTPSDFRSLDDLKRSVMAVWARYQWAAKPLKLTFRRCDLHALLSRLKQRHAHTIKFRGRNTSA